MNFMQWLNSLDELLYEVVSWIVFFPLTLWRTIRRPLTMMAYAEAELVRDEDEQYDETLSPPIFLILALVIAHAIGIAAGDGTNAVVRSQHGLAALVNDNTTLLMLRIVIFSVFPLMMATRLVRQRGALTRERLKAPFYAQCFAAAPFALMISSSATLAYSHRPILQALNVVIVLATLAIYGIVQTRWYAQQLGKSWQRGFLDASIGMVESLAVSVLIAYLFVL